MEVLHALIGEKTRGQQNLPASSLPHVLREDVGDRSQARDVQLNHRQRRVQLAIQERPLQSVTGVIDQDFNRNTSLAESPMQLDDCRNI